MTNALAPTSPNRAALLATMPTNKDAASRLRLFVDWLDKSGGEWLDPDLAAYRDHLLTTYIGRNDKPLTPASVAAHLSTIRGHYADILKSNSTRDLLYGAAAADAASYADKKAVVDELITRIGNATDADASPVEIITVQDEADSEHIRLITAQAEALLEAPGSDRHSTPLQARRDTALIALLLCTGIREAELVALNVDDLRQRLNGALALRIRHGKGAKQRLVPYGSLDWCLVYVDKWLKAAGITDGAVFRGLWKPATNNVQRVRPSRLALRAVQDILNAYPVSIDGEFIKVNPHDLRRTYARLLYDAGVPMLAIQQNLGHSDSRVTERYIGKLDAEQRKPPSILRPPHLKRGQFDLFD